MSTKIIQALWEVMNAVGYVQKTGENKFHGYRYAGEADLLEKLRPAMLKHGLLLIPSVTSVTPIDDHGNTTVRLEYTLAHKDGDVWPDKIGAAGTGNDRNSKGGVGDKGTYKAITGANKYLLFKLFQIETGDDPEVESAADKEPPPQLTRVPDDIDEFVTTTLLVIDSMDKASTLSSWWGENVRKWNPDWLPRARFVEIKAAYEKRLGVLNGKVAA